MSSYLVRNEPFGQTELLMQNINNDLIRKLGREVSADYGQDASKPSSLSLK